MKQKLILQVIEVCANFREDDFQSTIARTDNIKIKRNNFFESFVRLSKCVQVINILQVQKMRTTLRCKLSFHLFAFFAETVSHLIPQNNYFVNPFFVIGYACASNNRYCQLEIDG